MPKHRAIELSEIVIMKMIALSEVVLMAGIFNRELDIKINRVVRAPVMRQELINFCSRIFFMLTGDMASIQSFLPSRLNCGKTNLVVSVDRESEQTPRFIREMNDTQKSLLY